VQEAALKFFECHGKPAISLELEEALHGPFRALDKRDMVFFLAAEAGLEQERMRRLAQASEPYCDNRILIQSTDNPEAGDVLPIYSSDVEFVNTIEYLIPLQVLSFLIADRRGIDLSIPLVASLDGEMSPAYED
jgi:fructoselysine-6-P-deglycase FrlB-like protein